MVDIRKSRLATFLARLVGRHAQPVQVNHEISQNYNDCYYGTINTKHILRNEYSIIDVPIGKVATIENISYKLDTAHVNRLHALGLTTGSQVTVLQHRPVTILQVDHLELALEHELARSILVSGII